MKMTMPHFPDRRVIFDLENIWICLLDEDSQEPPNWADWNPGCGPPQECRHSHLAHCIGGPGVGRLRLSKTSRCYWSSQGSSGMIISHFSVTVDPITSLLGKGKKFIWFLARLHLFSSWNCPLSFPNQLNQTIQSTAQPTPTAETNFRVGNCWSEEK